MNSLSAAELRDDLWVDLFPWLDEYVSDRAALLEPLAPASDWWFSEAPSFTFTEVDLEKVLVELAELYTAHHAQLTFQTGFPALASDLPIAALTLDTRSATTVRRLTTHSTFIGLAPLTVESVFAIPGTSAQTVQDTVKQLLICTVLRDPRSRIEGEDITETPPVITQLLDDLTQLAAWRHVRGRGDVPLVTVDIEDDSPEQIQELAARITAVTAAELPISDTGDAMDEIVNLVAQLDERESFVLRKHLVAAEQPTLNAIASELHLSGGRVSQIESHVKRKLNAACGFGTAVGNLMASMRVEIQPVASLERLLTKHPEIADDCPGLGVPLWLVLDRLDDYFEVTDGWAAAPDTSAAKRRTQTLLEDFESTNGVVPLDAVASVSMPQNELEQWLKWCGITVVSGSALIRVRKIADLMVGALEAVGEPQTSAQLAELVQSTRSEKSIDVALTGDDRVMLGDGAWRLAIWSSVKEPELAATDEADDFEVVQDRVVRRHRSSQVKTPEQTRALYRSGVVWRYRIAVSADHLRGSGFALPAGLAAAIGCSRGSTVELQSRLGTQMVRWTGAQPTSGTIRRFLRELPVEIGDDIFLEFGPQLEFRIILPVVVPEDADPLRAALSAIGNTDPMLVSERHVTRVLAEAVGLYGESRPRRILSAYDSRGEDDVLLLLEQAWLAHHDDPAHQESIDE